jgi:hypothetical protein
VVQLDGSSLADKINALFALAVVTEGKRGLGAAREYCVNPLCEVTVKYLLLTLQ